MHATIVVMISDHHTEEQDILKGGKSYASELDLDWNVTPLYTQRCWEKDRDDDVRSAFPPRAGTAPVRRLTPLDREPCLPPPSKLTHP